MFLPSIPSDWNKFLDSKVHQKLLSDIDTFLNQEEKAGKTIYPPRNNIFRALELCPVSKTKVVIVGQDPYHGPGQAHGLSFSVKKEIPLPPSLKNIFKERQEDLGISADTHGDLTKWAKEGVLLLNSSLSVEKSQANSHQKKGWEVITSSLLEGLASHKKNIVFIVWGGHAKKLLAPVFKKYSDQHCFLMAPHPSPLSSYRGFFGSRPFSKTNKYLESAKISPVNWKNT